VNRQQPSLTPRERDVAELLCQGLANQQIASVLQVEVGTVRKVMASLLRKTQTTNRTMLALHIATSTKLGL
jgi:DNA-binding NarL/FixJ family response regulator